MRSPAFFAIGLGFVLMGAGLLALTLRKPGSAPANPTKAQQREQAALAEENRKMRIGAAVVGGVGLLICIATFF